MIITKHAAAGTLESCDVLITVKPAEKIEIVVESTVQEVFEQDIINCVKDTLEKLEVTAARILVQDKGAFDCTISARVETAVLRSQEGVQ